MLTFKYVTLPPLALLLGASVTLADCTLDGITKATGQTATFYKFASVRAPLRSCSTVSLVRTCRANGSFDGSAAYNKTACAATIPRNDSSMKAFGYFYGYAQAPYSDVYKIGAFAEAGRKNIPLIIHADWGEQEKLGWIKSESVLNEDLYAKAIELGTPIWLQFTTERNYLIDAKPVANRRRIYAAEIIPTEPRYDASKAAKFLAQLQADVTQYSKYVGAFNAAHPDKPLTCTIIVLNEASIWHISGDPENAGGTFWSWPSAPPPVGRYDATYLDLFANRVFKIEEIMTDAITKVDSSCRIGTHHSGALFRSREDTSSYSNKYYKAGFATLLASHTLPEFFFFGQYLKFWPSTSTGVAAYEKELRMIDNIMDSVGVPWLHFAQGQTMPNFGHGAHRGLTRSEIDYIVRFDAPLKRLSGTGFDAINASTVNLWTTPDAFDPNTSSGMTYETSKDRYDYEMAKMFERRGGSVDGLYDIVIYARMHKGSQLVEIQRSIGKTWDKLGYADAQARGMETGPNPIIFRGVDLTPYKSGNQITLRFTTNNGIPHATDYIEQIFTRKSRPSNSWVSARAIAAELTSVPAKRQYLRTVTFTATLTVGMGQ